jgi:hypothetical protein
MIIWESPQKTVDLGDTGFYSVSLGSSENPLDSTTLQLDKLWIELTVDGGEPLTPRIRLRSVPFAVRAGKASSVADGAVTEDAIADGAISSAKVGGLDWSKVSNKPSTLGGLSCSSGQVAVWNGSNWRCQGQVATGQDCSSGQVVTGINAQGDVVCGTDQVNNYTAGGGLSQSGTTFSLAQQSCSSGVAVGIDSLGSLICQSDSDTTYDRSCPSGEVVGGLDPDGSVVCVTDQDSGGDITHVNAKNGIKGGGLSGSVDLSVDYGDLDYTQIQQRLSSNCSDSKVLAGINQDGSPICRRAGLRDGADPSSTSNTCGEFVPAQVCPVGSKDGPDCSNVGVGAFCEGDSGCGGNLNNSLDNCGTWDWYIKTGP